MKLKLFGLLLLTLATFWAIYSTSIPKNIRISNISSNSLSLTWTTSRPTKGCVLNFRFRFCDDHYKRLTSHHVTVKNLKPETTYKLLIQNGLFLRRTQVITSAGTENPPPASNPAYGQVVLADGIELARYVNVFVDVNGETKSALTNDSGGFTLDLAEARNQNAFFLNVDGEAAGSARKLFFLGEHQPIGTIRLEPKKDINPLSSVKEQRDSAKTLFHRLSRTYWDAIVINILEAEFNVQGVVQVKYDAGLDKTLVFAAVKNLPLRTDKVARIWLAKNISEYLPAGVFEFAAEAGDPVGYSVFSGDGDLRNYEEILVSYDSPTGVDKPESAVLRERIPKQPI